MGLITPWEQFYTYCNQWKLTVNVDKTKVMVFSKGPTPKNVFYFHDNVIESVKEFKYLGIIFSRSGSFCKAKKHLYEQAQKAMYGVIRKIRQFNLPLECQLDLFDKIVVPVLLYGCEIWGFESAYPFKIPEIYILECIVFELQRKNYLPEKYYCRSNFYKFSELMTTADYNVLTK